MSGADPSTGSARTLWLGVGLLFTLLVLAWTCLFVVASRYPVETVPLEHSTQP